MEKICYTGIVESGVDGYYVTFPDLPGCFGTGKTMPDAALNAERVLSLHLSGLLDSGEPLPHPTNVDKLTVHSDVRETGRLVLGVEAQALTMVGLHIRLDRYLVRAIDAHCDNPSKFLATAAREKLRGLYAPYWA